MTKILSFKHLYFLYFLENNIQKEVFFTVLGIKIRRSSQTAVPPNEKLLILLLITFYLFLFFSLFFLYLFNLVRHLTVVRAEKYSML